MKKYLILIAAVALMAMTACNKKPAKETDAEKAATEQVDAAQDSAAAKTKVAVEHAAPTADGKDHVVAEYKTKDYQLKLENLADGTYRLSMWKAGQDKSGKPEQVVETKQCVMQADNYLMKGDDGKVYVINAAAGAEQFTIMNDKEILHHSEK